MRHGRVLVSAGLLLPLAGAMVFVTTRAADPSVQPKFGAPTVSYPVGFAISPPLSHIKAFRASTRSAPAPEEFGEEYPRPIPASPGGAGGANHHPTAEEVLQTEALKTGNIIPQTTFSGVGFNGLYPPDPNIAVGPNHIVELVNTEIAVFSKTGSIYPGYPKQLNLLWTNLGGSCSTNDVGDPIVQYDKLADRFIVSQIGNRVAPFSECIAVSTTNDPTGSYYMYSYNFNSLDDYPKFGIWPTISNAAYLTSYASVLCAYDRSAMLIGATAAAVCFDIFGVFMPSDLDGSNPPLDGSPGYFMDFDTTSSLRLYKLAPNFAIPSNSSLDGPTEIPVATFDPTCGTFNGIPQPDSSPSLEALCDRLMYRLAYRNFGDHEAMVVNHSVTTGASVGVRWYEFRKTPASNSGDVALYQQGTFAPDSSYRWMGSIAMDQLGDMGLGYSLSSSTIYPSISYTGRTASDPLGSMNAENSLQLGSGSQTDSNARWGDYSSMRIDPSDDCLFWYVNEYYAATSDKNWSTAIGSFKFNGCNNPPGPDFGISASSSPRAFTVGSQATSQGMVTVAWLNGLNGPVQLTTDGACGGASGITCTLGSSSLTQAIPSTSLSVQIPSGTAPGSYPITVSGTSGSPSLSHSSIVGIAVVASPTATATQTGTATPTATATTTKTQTRTATPTATVTATTTATATPTPIPITMVGSTSTSITTVTVPAGVQNGDLLLAFYSYWSLATATAPSGWQVLHTATSTNSGVETVWYRFANNDAPGKTYAWSFGGSGPYAAGGMLAYRGVISSGFEDGFCINQGHNSTPTLCSFTTTSSNDSYVSFFATENANLVLPADLNGLVVQQYLNGQYFGVAAAAKSLGLAGVVSADAGSMNNGGWATIAFALKPIVASGATPTPTGTGVGASATTTATPMPGTIQKVGATSTTNTHLTVPSGVQNGDLLLAFFSYWSPATATAPNGWTLLHTSVASGSGTETVWYRYANNDSPGATYTWSFSGPGPYESGGMLAYRGVDPAALEDGNCITQGHTTVPTLCSFTTAFNNDEYVGLFATENTGLAMPGDLTTEALLQYSNGNYFGVAAGDKPLGAAGVIPFDTSSMNNGGWASIAFALKPAATGPPAPTPVPSGITFVNSSSSPSSTLTVPTGVQNGDLLLAFYSYWHFATATAPGGWTLLNTEPSGSSGVETVWYRFAGGDAPGSTYTWSFSGPGPYESGGILAYRGVTGAPFVDGSCLDQGNNANPTLCTFNTTSNNAMYVGFFCTENTGLALPADLTGRVIQQYTAGQYFGVAAADKALGTAGAAPADTGSMSSGGWETIVIGLKHQ